MGLFAKGELVIIPFPFSDLSVSKMRPALIIADLENDDYIMVQITSKQYNDKHSIIITSKDLSRGNLHFESYVKYSKIFTADKILISKSIGKLKNNKFNEVLSNLIKLLKGE